MKILNEINNVFKIPLDYQEKCTLHRDIIIDLELIDIIKIYMPGFNLSN